jgi:D-aminopeptidase
VRLRDLGLTIGALAPGPLGAVTDVPGVRVGHAPGAVGGITALIPFAAGPRRFFVGRWSLDGGDELTGGLAMTEDFGTLSTPLVMAPPAAAGRVYDGLLAYEFQLDSGLSEDAGWPPGLITVDGGPAASVSLHASLGAAHVSAALSTAANGLPVEGQVGIGRGLAAFGARAGVGTASRQLPDGRLVGVLLAANGGEPEALSIDGHRVGPSLQLAPLPSRRRRTFAAVVVTDAPLIPRQLDRLAQRAAFGLVRVGLLDGSTTSGTAVALSTTGLDDETAAPADPGPDGATNAGAVVAAAGAESGLATLFQAAAEACEEATLNALVAASVQPSLDDTPVLPTDLLPRR